MPAPTIAAMGGALLRVEEGWRWRDGRAEPRVHDVTALEAYEFPRITRVSPRGEGRVEYLALPRALAASEPELVEFLSTHEGAAVPSPEDPTVIEVPWTIWEPWARACVVGLRWDAADEEDLLREADAQQRR